MNPKTRTERFLVIGGCAAGMSAASKAKRLNPNLDVLAFEKTPHVSYSACGIPYYVADLVREPEELVTIPPEEFRKKRDIQVFTQHEVVAIQPTRRRVTTVELATSREKIFEYDKLLIAVGGLPGRLNLPGMELRNVFTIQTLQDGVRLRTYVDKRRPQQAVIVGGGYIAMEMAEALRLRNIAVTVVERNPQILSNFEPEIAQIVADELRANGVEIRAASEIEEIAGQAEATAVRVRGQAPLPSDLVLVCVGLQPNTRLAEEVGIRVGNTGALSVDWKLQTSTTNIFAAGDCVEVKNLVSGQPDYIPLGPTANKQGRVVGENIGGGTATFRGVVGTSVFKTFSLEVARTGLSVSQARTAGFDAECAVITDQTRAGYYSGVKKITVAVVFDKRSGRLLGAQMVGEEGVSKRIDILATALTNRMTLNEIGHLDLSYAPPFAPVWDPVLVAVNVAKGKM